jgi:hypothetical protein
VPGFRIGEKQHGHERFPSVWNRRERYRTLSHRRLGHTADDGASVLLFDAGVRRKAHRGESNPGHGPIQHPSSGGQGRQLRRTFQRALGSCSHTAPAKPPPPAARNTLST